MHYSHVRASNPVIRKKWQADALVVLDCDAYMLQSLLCRCSPALPDCKSGRAGHDVSSNINVLLQLPYMITQ